jgi:hypothetical protein
MAWKQRIRLAKDRKFVSLSAHDLGSSFLLKTSRLVLRFSILHWLCTCECFQMPGKSMVNASQAQDNPLFHICLCTVRELDSNSMIFEQPQSNNIGMDAH